MYFPTRVNSVHLEFFSHGVVHIPQEDLCYVTCSKSSGTNVSWFYRKYKTNSKLLALNYTVSLALTYYFIRILYRCYQTSDMTF